MPLKLGDISPAVGAAQGALKAAGYSLAVDNHFGPRTEDAVRHFQAAHGLVSDGIVGPATLKVLEAFTRVADPVQAQAAELLALVQGLSDPIRAVLSIAIHDLGKAESPKGSNQGPDIQHLEPNGAPWCASAVCSWIRLGLGVDWAHSPMGKRIAKVLADPTHPTWPSLEGWGTASGRMLASPQPGAIFLMGRRGSSSDQASGATPGHCGLVVAVKTSTVITVDGNVGDRVSRCERELGTLKSFIRWW